MKAEKLVKVIKAEWAAKAGGQPVFVQGPPGIGKSALAKALAKSMNYELIDIRLALLNPIDLRGFPVVKDGYVEWVPPTFFHEKKNCVIFFDEINVAPPTTQASAYQILTDRQIGEVRIDLSNRFLAAGNRATDRAVVHEMPSALRNRFAMWEMEPDIDSWKDWALNNDIDPLVPSFLNYVDKNAKSQERPYGQLFWFDPKVHKGNFPSPRSWEAVSNLIKEDRGFRTDAEVIGGHVGEGTAIEFCAFAKVADQLPDIPSIVDGKSKPDLPKNPDARYAFCGALVGEMMRRSGKKETVEAVRNVAAYVVQKMERHPEYAVLAMKDFCRTSQFKEVFRQVVDKPEWISYSAAYGDLLI